MAHKGAQDGNTNALTHGIYRTQHPLNETDLAAIAEHAIRERDTATLRKLTNAPTYRNQPEKRRALRRVIRAIIAKNILETNEQPARSTDRPAHTAQRTPAPAPPRPRIAIGH
jgi:hypothetical protein